MRRPARLFLPLLLVSALRAQQPVQDAASLPALGALGFPAGARLDAVARIVDSIDGGRLRCDRSRLDARVHECRATLTMPAAAEPVELWLSAIDSVSGILTLASTLAPDELDALRAGLEGRYGRVGARVQNQQWMMQWVRRGRMLRLTWKAQQGGKATSLSLVDGPTLDGWRAPRRSAPPRTAPARRGAPPPSEGPAPALGGERP